MRRIEADYELRTFAGRGEVPSCTEDYNVSDQPEPGTVGCARPIDGTIARSVELPLVTDVTVSPDGRILLLSYELH